jgi:hypothetical protein
VRLTELAELAASIGAGYAACANEGDHRFVREAHQAFPSSRHLPNFRKAFGYLVRKPRYDLAGEVFAYARSNLGADEEMADAVCRMLTGPMAPDDLLAFMGQLAAVEPDLAARPLRLADWRLELARYHLLAGNELAAAETYKRCWEEAGSPERRIRRRATEALLRHGLLEALGDGVGHRKGAEKLLAKLAKVADGENSRPALIARAVVDRNLDEGAFRSRAAKVRISRSEVELVLAANASYTERDAAKANYLRLAWEVLSQGGGGFAWPYELIRFKQESLLRPAS